MSWPAAVELQAKGFKLTLGMDPGVPKPRPTPSLGPSPSPQVHRPDGCAWAWALLIFSHYALHVHVGAVILVRSLLHFIHLTCSAWRPVRCCFCTYICHPRWPCVCVCECSPLCWPKYFTFFLYLFFYSAAFSCKGRQRNALACYEKRFKSSELMGLVLEILSLAGFLGMLVYLALHLRKKIKYLLVSKVSKFYG